GHNKNQALLLSRTEPEEARMNIADEVFSEEHDTEAPPRVLIVDDDTQLTEAFSRLLKSAGCDVVTAPNGRAAGQLVARTRFDVVMSDVQMADMNGVELLELLRTQDPDLSVLLISGAP